MRYLRVLSLAFLSFVFALAAGTAGAQNVKQFTLTELALTGTSVSAKFTNADNGNSTFNAITLTVIASGTAKFSKVGVKIDGVEVNASNVFLQEGDTKLVVTNLSPVKKSKWVTLAATVTFTPSTGQCVSWHGTAFTGSVSSPSQLFQQISPDPITSVGDGCKLTIGGATSLVRSSGGTTSSPFSVVVNVAGLDNVSISGAALPYTLAGSAGCSFTTNPTGTTGTTLSGLIINLNAGTTTCTLTATTTSPSLTGSTTLPVFDGVLGCDATAPDALELPLPVTVPATAGEFHGTVAAGQTGYLAGVRGVGDGKDNGDCTLLNYTLTNHIAGGTSTDPMGNNVPAGYYSFSFDPSVPNPVVAILSTYAPEWGDTSTGLPTRKTIVCVDVPCTTAPPSDPATVTSPSYTGPWKLVPACLSTAVTHDSIPNDAPGACLASEGWVVLPEESCPLPQPSTGTYKRCLQVTTIAIIGSDPVFGR